MWSVKGSVRMIANFALALCAVSCLPSVARAQNQPSVPPLPNLEEHAVKQVSPHVYVIPSRGRALVPNVGIIVGNKATLVVDTGMGPQNGALVVREVKRITRNPIWYLTTTHFHPEHVTGEQSFPPGTIWIMPEAQKEDIDKDEAGFMQRFSQMSPGIKALLQDVKLRPPDILFQREAEIDLGGLTARMFWLGPAHTHGDELIYVEQDGVLLPGDIVENKIFPLIPDATGSAVNWIAVLGKIEPLHPRVIIPDHGDFGDGSLIAKERAYLQALEIRVRELKGQGKSADQAAQLLTAEFQSKYPGWTASRAISTEVQRFYEELQ
jgi:glyoxylase-like metal-dependent hydrolase (beta-lactamase superfamily II)